MSCDRSHLASNRKLVAIGTGLIALDVVPDHNPTASRHLLAGGSCGNVLTILSYLGWHSFAVGRLGNDLAGKRILRDFGSWRVKTPLLEFSDRLGTPVYVEHLRLKKNGSPTHRFQGMCPNCQSSFPQYRPLLSQSVSKVKNRIPEATAFYSDRISMSALELSKYYKEKGAIVMFEPSGIRDETLFRQCLETMDILKYSEHKRASFQTFTLRYPVPLEVETMGGNGLRYRLNHGGSPRRWVEMKAVKIGQVLDSSGAGDWCSAGMLHVLGREGTKEFLMSATSKVQEALSFGQLIAGLNCCFIGARGLMYQVKRSELHHYLEMNASITHLTLAARNERERRFPNSNLFCRQCSNTGPISK